MHRTRDRRALIAAIGLSSFGDELAIVALALRVESLTGSAGMVALLFIVSALPHVLFAPFSGWLTDRRETVQTLRWCALVQAVVAAALAFAVGLPLVFLLAFALGALASVTGPSVFALVPLLDEEGDTSRTNAKIEICEVRGVDLGSARRRRRRTRERHGRPVADRLADVPGARDRHARDEHPTDARAF